MDEKGKTVEAQGSQVTWFQPAAASKWWSRASNPGALVPEALPFTAGHCPVPEGEDGRAAPGPGPR